MYTKEVDKYDKTADKRRRFLKMPIMGAKNRKPFLDFLSWCAVLCSGGYFVWLFIKTQLEQDSDKSLFYIIKHSFWKLETNYTPLSTGI